MQLTTLLTLYTVLKDNLFLPRPRLAVPGLGTALHCVRVYSTSLQVC